MILQFPFYWVNARTSPVQFQVSPEPESEIMYPGEDTEALYLLQALTAQTPKQEAAIGRGGESGGGESVKSFKVQGN